jgi:hypothetical protein
MCAICSVFAADSYENALAASEGFTGADLKRVVEDAKSLYAFDRAANADVLPTEGYLLRAIEGVALNRLRYAEAEAGARANLAATPRNPGQFYH